MRKYQLLLFMIQPIAPAWSSYHEHTDSWTAAHDDKWKIKREFTIEAANRFKIQHRRYRREGVTTLLLFWWNFQLPFLERLPSSCGGCWTSNDRNREFNADAILFDNTRYKKARLQHDLPNFENRNTDSQYWIFWPREAASKGISKGTGLNLITIKVLQTKKVITTLLKGTSHSLVKNWDGAFNLTCSYRRDSDIVRPFGNIRQALLKSRIEDDKILTFSQVIQRIMKAKKSNLGNHTAWVVSNCNKTNGARARFEYAQKLFDSGLKIDAHGDCFNSRLEKSNNGTSLTREDFIKTHKFYLGYDVN